MHIKMNKINEDNCYVIYHFETDIDIGDKTTIWATKNGYCKFNKHTEEFELDLIETDKYFLTKNNREIIKVMVALIRIKRENGPFPDILDIATG